MILDPQRIHTLFSERKLPGAASSHIPNASHLSNQGILPGRLGAAGSSAVQLPHRRQNALEHSEVFCVCLYLISVNHGTSLSLTLEELLIRTALYWLARNQWCFLAAIFSDLVVVQAFRPQLSPHPNACLTSLLLRVIPDKRCLYPR